MDYIEELQAAILNLHGCSSQYVETVPVVEEFQGETVWQGDVEVFDIRGHQKLNAHMRGDMQPEKTIKQGGM